MPFTVEISKADFQLDASDHLGKVEQGRVAYNKLLASEEAAKTAKKSAISAGDAQTNLEADKELERIASYWPPFISAYEIADDLKQEGYKLADENGAVAPPKDGYQSDPLVTLFLLIVEAVVDGWYDKVKEKFEEAGSGKISINQFGEAIIQLTPGLRVLQDLRDQIIPPNDNGEVARILRDPIKRPLEIVQNIRDSVISPNDNSEVAQILRDPIKQPVKVVKKVFKKIFG